MKKLFHVLVVGGAVIGTGGGCAKAKAPDSPSAQPGSPTTTAKPDSDTNGTPETPPPPQEKGGGAGSW
ncbi:hypothetical protein [Hyalangium versicolor]|uniref:hypothetical protein n=1 Tax=Hyalangium versicolor TaxID=2861190 RepID=UPI001CCCCFB2|nr:hypothetical protein [Hyalangium versicolor]